MSTILIVEDHPALREVMALALNAAGFAVIEASNGAVALELLADAVELPKRIFLDSVMPVMDGPEMFRHLKQHPRLSRIPVVMMTGLETESLAGIDAPVVRKPVQLTELLKWARREDSP